MKHFPPRCFKERYDLLSTRLRQHCNSLDQTFTDWHEGKTEMQEFKGKSIPEPTLVNTCFQHRPGSSTVVCLVYCQPSVCFPLREGIVEYAIQSQMLV